jgi:UDPglucose--hexose-1-phosphate uridylyltransferase
MFDMINPRGASELVVESPRHDDTLASMGPAALESVLWMYRDRLLDLKRDGQIRDILVSRHHKKPGVAGHHPYSRVTAIPIVFDETRRELREAREYYQYKRRCLYCDILRQEIGAEERVVRLTPAFAAIVPYAPRVPLETWIVPRQHACSFEEAIKPETLGDLARLLSEYFRTLAQGFGDPGYEMVLHTAPNLRSRILQGDWATIRDDYHWHIEIVPEPEHANRVGGIFVNETRPEASAAELRQAWAKVARALLRPSFADQSYQMEKQSYIAILPRFSSRIEPPAQAPRARFQPFQAFLRLTRSSCRVECD